MPISRERKQQYFARLVSYLDEYNKIFIVQADHVSSLQWRLKCGFRSQNAGGSLSLSPQSKN